VILRINDDVLLKIFDFYLDVDPVVEIWQTLVHVCRRWRSLVFQSPRRLSLQLVCTPKTPAKDNLDVWPALPLTVLGNMASSGTDNVIAALERSNRLCHVSLWNIAAGIILEKVLAVMQVPFPGLGELRLESDDEKLPVIPDLFLGGSAPSLRSFSLSGIPFPGLPNLLMSTRHLVQLWLTNIPHSGYISPKSIVTLISALSSLDTLSLNFRSPQSRPDWQSRSLPPPNRFTLSLRTLYFKGTTEYLEELVTCIDTPHLNYMDITFFNQIDFDCPRLVQFINYTPTLRKRVEAFVQFDNTTVIVKFRYRGRASYPFGVDRLEIGISCREPDWQLSFIEQVCNSCLPPPSTVEYLCIEHRYLELVWKDEAIENTQWLQLLLPFTAVKKLYLHKEFAPGIAAALQELVGGRITEVLPSLGNIFVQGLEALGLFQKNIGHFVVVRQLSGHPVTISLWDRDSD
jgi:hypothetical protein